MELPAFFGHMDLRDACCVAFNQGHQSNKAGEQKHVTICHMPLGHKQSSRHTLGCVRPGGGAAAASLRQVFLLSCVVPLGHRHPNVPSHLSGTI